MSVQDGEIVKCACEFNLPDSTIAQNVFYWQAEFTAGASDSQVMTAVLDMLDDFYLELLTWLANDVTFNLSTVSKVAFDAGEGKWLTSKVLGRVLCGVTTTNTDDPAANVLAASIVANTDRPKSRGRKQIGGLVDNAFTDNDLITAALAGLIDAGQVWLDSYAVAAVGNLIPVIIRTGIDEVLPLVDLVANGIAGTMRTRKPGVGA
jgi:hypothetical protein